MHRQVSGADRKSEVVVGGSINLRAEQFRDRKEGIEITGQSCSREKGKVKRKGDLFTFLLLAETSKLFYIFPTDSDMLSLTLFIHGISY
jgi:hypothetical protein